MADPNPQSPAKPFAEMPDEDNPFLELQSRNTPRSGSDVVRTHLETAIRIVAEQALANSDLISGDAISSLNALIARLDKKLSDQVNQIIHNDAFKALEGSWRGLHYLVSNTETDEMLKIRVMNISKNEVSATLGSFKGTTWEQSPLFKAIYTETFGVPGGQPFGCLVGDYQFDHSQSDVEMLSGIARIAAFAHCPFIAAAAPSLMGLDTWQDLDKQRGANKRFECPEYAAWRSLRESEDSRYVGLTVPRILARLPYGKNNSVEGFAFEEEAEGLDQSKFCWMNSAYAFAVNINKSFKHYGLCTSIRGVESGGLVERLPVHTFPRDDGGVDMKCPVEIAVGERHECELANLGMMPLMHGRNTDYAVFIGAQSLHQPEKFDDPDSTANANLAARLQYVFACSRFVHFVKCMVRDRPPAFMERGDMERRLNEWLMTYVMRDRTAPQELRSRHPLGDARIVLEDAQPCYYLAKIYLRPQFQLEGLNVSLRFITSLPTGNPLFT